MTAYDIIEQSLQAVRRQGIKISRSGVMYNWCKSDGTWAEVPTACCALGAVLIYYKKAEPGFPEGWYKDLCEILGVDTYWLWRFWQGFDNGHPIKIMVPVGSKDGAYKEVEDKVSKMGAKLAKKYRD